MTVANAMQIGIVAKKVGLSVDTIRFYEPPARVCCAIPRG
jgi:hypothetical protein